jgi:hypothetical protein
MSDTLPNVTNDAIAEFQVEWERISASIDRSTALRRNLIKQARDNGIPTEMAVLAVRTKKKHSAQEATRNLADLLRSLSLVHIPISQDDLFDWPQGMSANTAQARESWDAEGAGYAAGSNGADPESCPYQPGSDAYALWGRAYQRGAEDHAARSGGTERVPAERTRRARGPAQGQIAGTERRSRRRGNGSDEVQEAAE